MIHEAGGIFINALKFTRGERIAKHCHAYDHYSILAKGRVALVTKAPDTPQAKRQIEGPVVILIEAGVDHAIYAASANVVWYCIHNSDRAEASMSDRAIIAEAKARG